MLKSDVSRPDTVLLQIRLYQWPAPFY